GFFPRHTAPRLSQDPRLVLDIVIDNASVEFFADSGLSVMTSIFFVSEPFTEAHIQSDDLKIKSLTYTSLSSIWH
ncbi:MAG TPA: GH32 C-terminal domain-containing protein, partial [Saprospiraceae bacterium]|nr:GH32 C-terminal domain-containing protein [Saprospiraceae bacterium]